MEEGVTRRTVAISVQTTKLTGRVLHETFQKFLAQAEKQCQASLTPHERQSVKQLIGHGGPPNSIQLKGDACLFDWVVQKSNMDYALRKVGPEDYLLFFRIGQADAATAAFSEYIERAMTRQKGRPSIPGQFRQFGAHIKTRQKEREKTRKAVQER